MRDTDYAFCVARLRANERYFLSSSDIFQLCNCKSLDEALEILLSKKYIQDKGSVRDIVSYQNQSLWDFISTCVPDKKELDVLCIVNDFFNIKTAVKCFFAGKDANLYYIKPTTIDLVKLTKAVNSLDFAALNDSFSASAKNAYDMACKTENGQSAEIIIDKATTFALKNYSKGNKGLISEVCAFLCDTANIKIALRCFKAKKGADFIDAALGECVYLNEDKLKSLSQKENDELFDYLMTTRYKDGLLLYKENFAEFDKWCDDEVIRICKKAKYTAFGFDPVCAFYYAKINEIKTVRIILSGIEMGTEKELIIKRVRETYA